jgi:hypothetical protein
MMEKIKDIAGYVLAGLIVTGFFILLYMLIRDSVPEGNRDILHIVVGSLVGSFGTVVQYFFGSSMGSKEKTKLMGK